VQAQLLHLTNPVMPSHVAQVLPQAHPPYALLPPTTPGTSGRRVSTRACYCSTSLACAHSRRPYPPTPRPSLDQHLLVTRTCSTHGSTTIQTRCQFSPALRMSSSHPRMLPSHTHTARTPFHTASRCIACRASSIDATTVSTTMSLTSCAPHPLICRPTLSSAAPPSHLPPTFPRIAAVGKLSDPATNPRRLEFNPQAAPTPDHNPPPRAPQVLLSLPLTHVDRARSAPRQREGL
jgi:hypothetical protein